MKTKRLLIEFCNTKINQCSNLRIISSIFSLILCHFNKIRRESKLVFIIRSNISRVWYKLVIRLITLEHLRGSFISRILLLKELGIIRTFKMIILKHRILKVRGFLIKIFKIMRIIRHKLLGKNRNSSSS